LLPNPASAGFLLGKNLSSVEKSPLNKAIIQIFSAIFEFGENAAFFYLQSLTKSGRSVA
jgi:hypothetical protein